MIGTGSIWRLRRAAKFAKGVGFGGQIADEIRLSGRIGFSENNYAGVDKRDFSGLPTVVDVAKLVRERHRKSSGRKCSRKDL